MVDDAKKKRDRTTFKPHYIATATGSIHVRRPWRGKVTINHIEGKGTCRNMREDTTAMGGRD